MTTDWRTHSFTLEGLGRGVAALCPASTDDRPRWFMTTCDGLLLGIDADDGRRFFELQLPLTFEAPNTAEMAASVDGRFVTVVPRVGFTGVLVDTSSGTVLKTLGRTDYHANITGWAPTIVRRGSRDVLISTIAWNELEALELPSLTALVPGPTEPRLDYFYGVLSASPTGRRVTSSGWHWHPVGSVNLFEVDPWLATREAPEMKSLVMSEWWDGEVCWLDDDRLAMFGDQSDGAEEFGEGVPYFNRQTGIAIFDVQPHQLSAFLPDVPGRALGSDGERLYVMGDSTRAYSLEARAWLEPYKGPTDAWHRGARVALCCPALRGEPGPCQLVWRPTELPTVARESLQQRALELQQNLSIDGLIVLADALEELGVSGEPVDHCREVRPHGHRCWVVEGLLHPSP